MIYPDQLSQYMSEMGLNPNISAKNKIVSDYHDLPDINS